MEIEDRPKSTSRPRWHRGPSYLQNSFTANWDYSHCRIETTMSDRPLESMEMLSGKLNLRLSQVKDSLMNILQVQICSRGIPEIQNAMGTLFSGQRDTEYNQEHREGSNEFKTKITKKDPRSASYLGDTEGLSPYSSWSICELKAGDICLLCTFCTEKMVIAMDDIEFLYNSR